MADKIQTAPSAEDQDLARQVSRLTRRSFAVGGAASLVGLGVWGWLGYSREIDKASWPLRRMLEANEKLARACFSGTRPAPEFDVAYASEPRVNGRWGLGQKLNAAAWRLKIENPESRPVSFSLTLDDIQALPRVDSITELKCVEGWSTIVHWTGARLSDLMAKFRVGTRSGQAPDSRNSPGDLLRYVGLATPDKEYFVGLDMPSALHSQTLLCYAMNGEPLTAEHGAPLRLVIPVKYGFKSIKRLGTLRFSDDRPADYWAEMGYDWYAGM